MGALGREFWQRQRGGEYFRDKQPLTDLVIELILLCASPPRLVSRRQVEPELIFIERGSGALEPGFELSEYFYARGAPAPRFGPPGARAERLYASPTYVMRRD